MENNNRDGTESRIRQLYSQFRRHSIGEPERCSALHDLLMHPLSQQKLTSACACVISQAALRRDLVADLKQEATCRLLARFQERPVPFHDQGVHSFAGWLWTLWSHACGEAWREMQPKLITRQLLQP